MKQQQMVADTRVFSRPIAYQHDISFDEPFEDPSDYRYEIDVIRNSTPNDIINLHINGPGGAVFTATSIIKAMEESQATIVGHLSGLCCSAHTMVFLACDEYVVPDDVQFMVHTSSSGTYGKESDMFQYANHYNTTNKERMYKHYRGFMTDKEIEECINGKDFWMDAEEVILRLEARKNGETEQALEELSRDELKEIATQTGIKFTSKTSTDKLRTLVKEKVDEQS